MDVDAYTEAVERLRRRHEDRAITVFRTAIKSQVETAANAIGSGLGLTLDEQPMERAYKDVYRAAYMDFAAFGYSHVSSRKADVDEETKRRWRFILIQYFFANLQVLLSLMNRTTTRDILLIVQMGVENGLTNEQIAQTIRSRSDSIASRRAVGRASGTVVAASNHGIQEGGRLAVNPPGTLSPTVVMKSWVTTLDERTRRGERGFNHAEAHLQTVPVDSLFTVSREFLNFPGDMSNGASIGNVAGCRCITLIEV